VTCSRLALAMTIYGGVGTYHAGMATAASKPDAHYFNPTTALMPDPRLFRCFMLERQTTTDTKKHLLMKGASPSPLTSF